MKRNMPGSYCYYGTITHNSGKYAEINAVKSRAVKTCDKLYLTRLPPGD